MITETQAHQQTVLVIGGSGFIGSHCILQLLKDGYNVRATLRNLNQEHQVREMLTLGGLKSDAPLSFVEAELNYDNGWLKAVENCDYVLHAASSSPPINLKNKKRQIYSARDGVLRVLRAARDENVKRVLLTSSFEAIAFGYPKKYQTFNEENWTKIKRRNFIQNVQSKTIMEKAAWEYIASKGRSLELTVINPAGVYGPVFNANFSKPIQLIRRILDGDFSKIAKTFFNLVDIRDLVDLYLRAMTHPLAKGERFLAVSDGNLSFKQITAILRDCLGDAAYYVPKSEVRKINLRHFGYVDSLLKEVVPNLGKPLNLSNEKAKKVLGWEPRSNKEILVDTATSLLKMGYLSNIKLVKIVK